MNNSWTFEDQDIVDKFDSHVREQLPWYDMVTDAVIYIIRNYLAQNKVVVDIGASTGNLMEKIIPRGHISRPRNTIAWYYVEEDLMNMSQSIH